MTTIKTCTIPDEYKHVVYKDLERYLTKEDLYNYDYTDAEKRQIISNLGIDEVTKIDDKLIPYSNNPVAGGVLFNEINKKADLQALQPLVKDVQKLKGKLPHGLILRTGDTATYYDTTKDAQVCIPTKLSDLENDVKDNISQYVWYYGSVNEQYGTSYIFILPENVDYEKVWDPKYTGNINAICPDGTTLMLRLIDTTNGGYNSISVNGTSYISVSEVEALTGEESGTNRFRVRPI